METRELNFSWRRETEAAAYTLTVALAGNPNPVIQRELEGTRYTHNLSAAPLEEGRYTWTVVFRDAEGNVSPAAPPWTFTAMPRRVTHEALFPPEDYSLPDTDLPNLVFTWNSSLSGNSRFQLADTPAFDRYLLDEGTGSGTREFRGRPFPPGTYYWRITTPSDQSGAPALQTPGRRLLVTGRLAAPEPESPAGRVIRDPQRGILFRWLAVPGADSYLLTLFRGTPGRGGNRIEEFRVGTNYHSLAPLTLEPGAYYWTIQALGQPGSLFQESSVESRTFQVEVPRRVVLESPASFPGIQIQRRGGVVRWSSSEMIGISRFILSQDPNPLTGTQVAIQDNPSWNITLPRLPEGTYYWTIQAETPEGYDISPAQPARFQVLPVTLPRVALDSPATFPGLDAQRRPGSVRWSSTETVGNSQFILSRDPNPLTGTPILTINNPSRTVTLPSLTEGTYYWTIQAETPDGFDISPAQPARFQVLPLVVPAVVLESAPAFPGVEARRQGVTLRWSSSETVESSRFILSRNPDLAGTPILSLDNPPRTVIVPALTEGTYYWTIRARTPDGLDISARGPATFRVLPIPLLGPPEGIQPGEGSSIDGAYLQRNRRIVFSWTAVPGANAYIFVLSRPGVPEPLVRSPPLSQTVFYLENLSILENGEYLWRVEGINITMDGTIDQHGEPGEFRFTLSIPQPGAPTLRDPGLLYGF
jgi:hypothetical protein